MTRMNIKHTFQRRTPFNVRFFFGVPWFLLPPGPTVCTLAALHVRSIFHMEAHGNNKTNFVHHPIDFMQSARAPTIYTK